MDEHPETTEQTTDDAPQAQKERPSRSRKLGAIAVGVVALAGVGTAIAASQIHGKSSSNGFGPRGFGRGNGQGPPAGGFGGGFGRGNGSQARPRFGAGLGFGGGLAGAATYLGISQSQLRSDLASGKTLAQIADATSGKSASGLISALEADSKQSLEAAVKSGRINQQLADQIEANLEQMITSLVNGTGFGGRGGFSPPSGGGVGPPGRQAPQPSAKTT